MYIFIGLGAPKNGDEKKIVTKFRHFRLNPLISSLGMKTTMWRN
jgi:hypothetical protein